MLLSIIICTKNRAEHLRQTLKAMQSVEVPGGGCELIVVDNASTDNTAAVVGQRCLPKMTVRYLHEPRCGQCHARNAGMAAASGEILLFTDDDVRPSENWIKDAAAPILDRRADAVAGGVKIASNLLRPWMTTMHKNLLASTEYFDPVNPVGILGANLAVSRQVLTKIPAFDVELGPGALGFCDDNLLSNQLKQADYRIQTAFHACVEHHFDASRLTRASWLDRSAKQGRSGAYLAHHWEHQEIPDAYIRGRRRLLRLLYMRLRHRTDWRVQEGISGWEMDVVSTLAFYQHFLRERTRPRNYEKHGLIKLHGKK